jgi:EpsI family protein
VTKLAIALAFLAVDFYTYRYFATKPVIPPRRTFAEFPLAIADWTCPKREVMDQAVEENLGVTDYLICTFTRGKTSLPVGVYVGYHQSQVREEGGGAGENSIHPPAHCLPGSGWDIIATDVEEIDLPGFPHGAAKVNRLVIAKGDLRQLVYYWYQGRGRVTAEGWKKIVYVGLDRATRGRTDEALVRFTIPIRKKDRPAERAFEELAPLVVARLADFVPE